VRVFFLLIAIILLSTLPISNPPLVQMEPLPEIELFVTRSDGSEIRMGTEVLHSLERVDGFVSCFEGSSDVYSGILLSDIVNFAESGDPITDTFSEQRYGVRVFSEGGEWVSFIPSRLEGRNFVPSIIDKGMVEAKPRPVVAYLRNGRPIDLF